MIKSSSITNIIADKPQKPNRSCRLSDSFKPNDYHQNIAKNEQIDLNNEFVKFTDYCLAHGKKYIDWNAAFNNWLRNAGGYKKSNKAPLKFMTLFEHNRVVLESMRS